MERIMREDMYKVIVERPRKGGWMDAGTARAYRNSEDAPAKVGIKKGYTHRKWLNENLAPLKRWLESQVNRPWDKVYAELCANIDRRNTVQEHIFAHIDGFVERETRLVEGEVFVLSKWPTELMPLEESRIKLYVHPTTGILRLNKHRVSWRRQKANKQKAVDDEIAMRRRELNPTEQLQKVEGVWYHVTLAPMDPTRFAIDAGTGKTNVIHPKHWDVLRKQNVSRGTELKASGQMRGSWLFGKCDVYAVTKRQLSTAELKHYQLKNDVIEEVDATIATNKNAGISRRFCLWRLLTQQIVRVAISAISVSPLTPTQGVKTIKLGWC
jgi:hypothetical protein